MDGVEAVLGVAGTAGIAVGWAGAAGGDITFRGRDAGKSCHKDEVPTMIRRLERYEEVGAARAACQSIAVDEVTFAAQWLSESSAVVMVQESGRYFEADEVARVARAFSADSAELFWGVVTDSPASAPEAYALGASGEDLSQICDELTGVSFMVVNASATKCIIVTAYDFKLIAGPLHFVTSITGEPGGLAMIFSSLPKISPARFERQRFARLSTWTGSMMCHELLSDLDGRV
jgi:hypothetical protein